MILQTKLHRPTVTPDLVCRQRLHACMDGGLAKHGILVSAPAGYGKSVLVSHWAELRPEPCAWLSLDESDSDLRVFAEYLVAAVRTVVPGACPETQALLDAQDLPPVQTLAGSLANELEAIAQRFLLVLDDLQRVSDSQVFDLLGILLEHSPRSLCLVLVTRRDPPLALSRLRARGQLAEVRLRDLAFTGSEAEALLESVAGISLSPTALAKLESEMEGWAVGLRLIILALANEQDPDRFLKGLRGGTELVGEYLVHEVLARRSPAVREMMLRTAILDRFCAPLCEAVCADDRGSGEAAIHGRDFIQNLVEGGLFTIPLDSQGKWYRYHHVFQRLLQDRLERDFDTESISALHLRASRWLEAQGMVPQAIDHALAAADATTAACIVERNRSAAIDSDRVADLGVWLDRLPDELRRNRIGLLMAEAYVAGERFELGRLSGILERANAFEADSQSSIERNFFLGALLFWNADGAGCLARLDEALDSLPEDDSWLRAEIELHHGLAMHLCGRSEDAMQRLEATIERNVVSQGLVWSRLVAGLMFLRLLRGELVQAFQEAKRMGEWARRTGNGYVEAWSAYVLGNATLRRFDLEAARQHLGLAASRRSILHTGAALDSVTGLALAGQMLGDPEEADAQVARARDFAQWSNVPASLTMVDSCEARIALMRGHLDEAARWQQSIREPFPLPPAFAFMEIPSVTECRVLAATADDAALREAAEKLQHLWDGFGALHYTCQQMEIAPLRALVLHRQGHTDEALKALEESLAMATQGGWVRPYVELGTPMADLLEQLPAKAKGTALVRQIRAGFRRDPGDGNASASASSGSIRVDLTNRERDVLDLLAERLRDKEIAQKLYISTETVKTHLRTLYRKLDCRDRRHAVERARELGVFP